MSESDADGELTEADRAAFEAAGVSLEGAPDDPNGTRAVAATEVALGHLYEDSLSVADVARLLSVGEADVAEMVTEREMTTVSVGDGEPRLPRWQFVERTVLPGLVLVLQHVGDVHPLTLAGFMTRPDVDLQHDGEPVSPVEWLTAGGRIAAVTDLASGIGPTS